MIERIREGKELLEKRQHRHHEAVGAGSSRARRSRPLTLGQLIVSLEDAGSGESRVVAKEKDILGYTERGGHPDHELQRPDPGHPRRDGGAVEPAPSSSARP